MRNSKVTADNDIVAPLFHYLAVVFAALSLLCAGSALIAFNSSYLLLLAVLAGGPGILAFAGVIVSGSAVLLCLSVCFSALEKRQQKSMGTSYSIPYVNICLVEVILLLVPAIWLLSSQ